LIGSKHSLTSQFHHGTQLNFENDEKIKMKSKEKEKE